MIKAEKITKKYGDLLVLDQVDMEVSKASVVSIVGRSGLVKVPCYTSWAPSICRIQAN